MSLRLPPSGGRGRLRPPAPFVALLVLLAAARAQAAPAPLHPRHKTYLERQWGVEVLGVREAAAGYMLEFRYRVLDVKMAGPLFERQTKPQLVDVQTGARLGVPTPPKTGALRNSNPPLQGRVYWMFFANPGRFVKPGRKVAVIIGDFRADGLVVQE